MIQTNENKPQQTSASAGTTQQTGNSYSQSFGDGALGQELDSLSSGFSRISGSRSEQLESIRKFAAEVSDQLFQKDTIKVYTLSQETGFPGVYPATVFALHGKIENKDTIILYPLVHELAHQALEPMKQQFNGQQIELARNIGDVLNDPSFLKTVISNYARVAQVNLEVVNIDIGGIDFIPAKMNFTGVGTEPAANQAFTNGYLRQVFQVLSGIQMHISGNAPKITLGTAKGNVTIRHEFGEDSFQRPNGLPVRVGQVSTLEYGENNAQNASFAISNSTRVLAKVCSYVDFINRGQVQVQPGQAPLPPLIPNVVITDFSNGDYTEPRGLIYSILAVTGLYDVQSYPWMNAFRNTFNKKGKNAINYRNIGVMGLDRHLAPALGVGNEPVMINTASLQDHELKNLLARVVDLNNMLFSIDVDSISSNSFINANIHNAAQGNKSDASKKANARLIAWADEFTDGEFSKDFPAGEPFFKSTSLVLPRGYSTNESGAPQDLRTFDYLGAMNHQAAMDAKAMNGVGNDFATELHHIYSNNQLSPLDRLLRFQKALRGVDTYFVAQTIRYFINEKAVRALVIGAQRALAKGNHQLVNKTNVGAYTNDSGYVSSFVNNAVGGGINWNSGLTPGGDNYGYSGFNNHYSGGSGIL